MKKEVLRFECIGNKTNEKIERCISLSLYLGDSMVVLSHDINISNYLIAILEGKIKPDFGKIYINETESAISHIKYAHKRGVYTVDPSMIVEDIRVMDNLFLSYREKQSPFLPSDKTALKKISDLQKKYSLEYLPALVQGSALNTFDKYMVAILHAILMGAKVLILKVPIVATTRTQENHMKGLFTALKAADITVMMFAYEWDFSIKVFNQYAIIREGSVTQVEKTSQRRLPIYGENAMLPKSMYPETLYRLVYADRYSEQELCSAIPVTDHSIIGILDHRHQLASTVYDCLQRPDFHEKSKRFLLSDDAGRDKSVCILDAGYYTSPIFPNLNLYDNITLMENKYQYNALGLKNKRLRNHLVKTVLKSLDSEYLIEKYGGCSILSNLTIEEQLIVETARCILANSEIILFPLSENEYNIIPYSFYASLFMKVRKQGRSVLIISRNRDFLKSACDYYIQACGS